MFMVIVLGLIGYNLDLISQNEMIISKPSAAGSVEVICM